MLKMMKGVASSMMNLMVSEQGSCYYWKKKNDTSLSNQGGQANETNTIERKMLLSRLS